MWAVGSYRQPIFLSKGHFLRPCGKGFESEITGMGKAMKRYWPLFVLPTMAAFTIGFIIPFVYGVYLSFCDFTPVVDAKWVGFANYAKIFYRSGKLDTSYLHSIWYTCLFAAVTVILINVIAFAIALALTKGFKGTNFFRTAFFLPNLIGGIVLSYIWLMILNSMLQNYSMTVVSTQWSAFWSLVVVVCWQQIGYMMIIYVAGLQNVSGDLLEAAQIDGANSWQTLTKITIPVMAPTITICTFLSLTNGFKLFDQNYALTGGNPGKQSELLALNIYNTMYGTQGYQGVGQAKAVLFFIMVALISLIQNKASRSKEVVD